MLHFNVDPCDLNEQLTVECYKPRVMLKNIKRKFKFRKIKEVCDIASGIYVPEYVSPSEGVKYIRVDSIREFIYDLNEEDTAYVPRDFEGSSSRVIAKEGDILLARTGTLGKAALVYGPIIGSILSQHITRLSIKKDVDLDSGFLTAYLNSDIGKMQISANSFGSTRPELTHEGLARIEFPEIGIGEQKKIGEEAGIGIKNYYLFFDLINEAIREYEKALDFEEFNKETIKIFETNTLEDNWVPRYYLPQYGDYTQRARENFVCKRLEEVAYIERGKGTRVSEYSKCGVPFVRTTSLINYSIDPFPDHYASIDVYNEFAQQTRQRDILLSIEGKIGNIAMLSSRDLCVFKNHIVKIRAKNPDQAHILFLYLASHLGQTDLKRNTVVQSTIPGLSSRIKDILIPISPERENALYEEHLNKAIKLLEQALDVHDLYSIHFKKTKRLIEDLVVE